MYTRTGGGSSLGIGRIYREGGRLRGNGQFIVARLGQKVVAEERRTAEELHGW